MRPDDTVFQGESFLGWHDRAGGDMETNFKFWASSKDFLPDDERTIWAGIEESFAQTEAPVGADEMILA